MKEARNIPKIWTLFIIFFLHIFGNNFALSIKSNQPSYLGQIPRAEAILSIQEKNQSIYEEPEEEEVGNTNKTDLLVFVHTGLNLTNLPLNLNDFQLLKLDSQLLFGNDNKPLVRMNSTTTKGNEDHEQEEDKINLHRQSRKINLLKGIWNKPKVSPLYLVNGTVCRFVNSVPICTTLATTGLLPNNPQTRPTANQFGTASNTVQSTNNQQQQQQQQFRPAAIMDDDPLDINVGSSLNGQNSTDTLINNNNIVNNRPVRQPQRPQQFSNGNQYAVVQAARPFNFLINRRPIPWRVN